MLRMALALGFGLAWVSSIIAQEQVSNYEHLKVLEPFLGPWVSDAPTQGDFLNLAEKGTPMVAKFNYRWTLKKNALIMNWTLRAGDNKPVLGKVLIGWCPKNEQIVSRAFTSAGSTNEAIWQVDEKTLKITGKGIGPEGKESSSLVLNKLTDEGTMIWQAINQVEDGEEKPDSPEVEFKRVEPAGRE